MAYEMISVMLSNLHWASSLMELCFACFSVKDLENFRVKIVGRKRAARIPPKTAPSCRPTPLASAAMEFPLMITDDAIRLVPTIPTILLNRFFFLACRLRSSISSSKYASISVIFFKRYVCDSCGGVGF